MFQSGSGLWPLFLPLYGSGPFKAQFLFEGALNIMWSLALIFLFPFYSAGFYVALQTRPATDFLHCPAVFSLAFKYHCQEFALFLMLSCSYSSLASFFFSSEAAIRCRSKGRLNTGGKAPAVWPEAQAGDSITAVQETQLWVYLAAFGGEKGNLGQKKQGALLSLLWPMTGEMEAHIFNYPES